jgi:hypothetical protein
MSATTAPVTTGGRVADEVHHRANGDERQTHRDQATECTASAVAAHRRQHGGDHREAGAQITGEPVAGDEQEQHRADAGEEQRRRGWKAGEYWHQEGRTEHRDDVLSTDADGARPTESLVGGDDGSVGWDGLPGQIWFGRAHALELHHLGTARH